MQTFTFFDRKTKFENFPTTIFSKFFKQPRTNLLYFFSNCVHNYRWYMLYILTSAWLLRSLFACQNMLFCRFSKFLHHFQGTKNDPLTYKKGKNATFLPKCWSNSLWQLLKNKQKKRFKINKTGWKRLKKVVRPTFGCAQHPKFCLNTQQAMIFFSAML